MKKYYVEIKDKRTGEVVFKANSDAIIGAVENGEDSVAGMCLTGCNTKTLVGTVKAVEAVVEKVKKEHPEIGLLLGGLEFSKTKEKVSAEKGDPKLEDALKAINGLKDLTDTLMKLKSAIDDEQEEDAFDSMFGFGKGRLS